MCDFAIVTGRDGRQVGDRVGSCCGSCSSIMMLDRSSPAGVFIQPIVSLRYADMIFIFCIGVCMQVGDTPLHYAARRDHPGIISTLIGAGADHAALNAAGQTPRQVARSGGQEACEQVFAAIEEKRTLW